MKMVYQYKTIFFNFSSNSIHFHPLQVENCDSNARLVEDEDDNGKFRLERVEMYIFTNLKWCLYRDPQLHFKWFKWLRPTISKS